MQNKAARPLFKQAISAVRKQVDSGQFKKKTFIENQPKVDNQYEDMSSGEQQRLKQLGVDWSKTKRIVKQSNSYRKHNSKNGSWKHDKFRENLQKQHKNKIQPYLKTSQSFTIKFLTSQQYNKIFQLVKSQKAFIQEINQNLIKFSKEYTFNTCKNIFKNEGIQFEDSTIKPTQSGLISNKEGKESIFNRIK